MPGRRIVIAGGTGFIGERLVTALHTTGEEVVVLSRHHVAPAGARVVQWDGHTVEEWAKELDGAYAVINLAGETVSQRWSSEARARIMRSRVDGTQAICHAIMQAARPPERWINASAVGYYGDRGREPMDERSDAGRGFLAETCIAWEEAVTRCEVSKTARTRLRISMVVGHQGALPALARLARLGLGGHAGSGEQMVSWIHLDDLVGMIAWLLDIPNPPEIVNAASPSPVSNAELMREVRKQLNVPFGLPAPAFGVKLVGRFLGPDADLILNGVRAVPTEALRLGFRFHCPEIADAIEDVLGK
ncbi:TIGR01777 family oxidoreductase [Fimbriimonas ginsengisoli]|uniref:Cell division inhibitor n=1 Tax=Fimbriimonas ginsengisoli Gsoil 348 TaxID=661478 RepID=A0A068NT37_FIMGI|nr:TIGR01777 family oxidoreductase [Fimbriimonas ginsengisoli]AIE86561.1 Cell division inhibitor [Fimbriimonas ginsengisoli Gsoil 348]